MKYLLSLFLSFLILISSAHKLDSLLGVLKNNPNDSISQKVNISLGRYYFKITKFDSAFYYYQTAYAFADQLDDLKDKSLLLYTMGNTHYWTGFYKEADSLYQKGLNLAYEINDTALIAKLHNSFGPNLLKLGDTIGAVKYLKKALFFSKNEKMKGNIYANLGQINRDQRSYISSLAYFEKSEQVWKKFKLQNHIARIQFEKGKIFLYQKQYNKAVDLIKRSIDESSLNSKKQVLLWKYKRLAEAYEGMQQFDSAYHYFVIHSAMFREVFSEEQQKNIKELELKYESRLKDELNAGLLAKTKLQSKVIQKQNFTFYLGLILLLIIVSIAYGLWRNYKKNIKLNILLKDQKKDILQQKAKLNLSNQKLLELDTYKQNLSAMLVHDLSNPLQLIKASTNNDKIIRSADQMIVMLDNLLTIQKIEEKKLELDLFDYQLSYLVDRLLEENMRLLKKKRIKISTQIRSNIFVNADSFLLERVLLNLLSNAIRFTSDIGCIDFDAQVLGKNEIRVSVSDTGDGIDENEISSIFDKYNQMNPQHTYNYGLGLSFCKLAVESMGGKITVKSQKGRGSVFSFTLKGALKGELVPNDVSTKGLKCHNEMAFTKTEYEALDIHIKQLKKLKIYELSDINAVLREVKKIESKNITSWVILVENAIYASNNELFNDLINI